jgi:hypothetical protein
MQKFHLIRPLGIFLLVLMSFQSYGQILRANFDSAEPEGKPKLNKVYTNDISSRARTDFATKYKDVSGEKWTITDEGYNVSFKIGEIKYSVRYDKKGYRLFTLRSYGEKQLPKNIRTLVRSTYFDYNIKWIEEIEKTLSPLVYVVLVEGDTEWIRLRIQDGEMIVMEKLDK